MINETMIIVKDVVASSKWYCEILNATSGHGGEYYDQIVYDGKIILQLHHIDDMHMTLFNHPDQVGRGIFLWFQTDEFEIVEERVKQYRAIVQKPTFYNGLARHKEMWLLDPNGYTVVISGPTDFDAPVGEYCSCGCGEYC